MTSYIYITPFFPSDTRWDGAYCYDFVRALQETNLYHVYVFKPGNGSSYVYRGIKVNTFPVKCLTSNIFPFFYERSNNRSFLLALEKAGISLKDIGVCHSNSPSMVGYLLKLKHLGCGCLTLQHHHSLQSIGLGLGCLRHCWLYNLYLLTTMVRKMNQVDCHVFISNKVRESFESVPRTDWTIYEDYKKQLRGLGFVSSPRVRHSILLHNGVDEDVFVPKTQVVANKIFTIGCIANFQPVKDYITLLRAVLLLKQRGYVFRLKIIGGDGTLGRLVRLFPSRSVMNQVKRFVKNNKLEEIVSFRREVDHVFLPEFYHSLDLFVLPSFFEGFGCVFAEAASCGVPFITCEQQGIADILHKEEGHLWQCKMRDPVDLANKIEYYIKNRPKQRIVGELGSRPLMKEFVHKLELLRKEMHETDH